MTQAPETGTAEAPAVDLVTVTIDDTALSIPKGTLVIRAAELLGVQIPRFCDHPLLEPVGACRQCLVEVEGQRKPMASCTTVATDGMVVRTQFTSPAADKAQHGVMELLLINHPLDCPVCDKGGECPLQDLTFRYGPGNTRMVYEKQTFEKPIPISPTISLDRERCILCSRCVRFSNEITGRSELGIFERGAHSVVDIVPGRALTDPYQLCMVDICPVGVSQQTSH
jgi:NADH-quinone oxidoreductase subunit G